MAAGKLTLRSSATSSPASCGSGRPTTRISTTSTAATLYGAADYAELPLPDQLHPDAETHRRIGDRFAALAFSSGGPFAVE